MSKDIKPPGQNLVLSVAWEGKKFPSTLGWTFSCVKGDVGVCGSQLTLGTVGSLSVKLISSVYDCSVVFKSWSIPELPEEWDWPWPVITKSPLGFCCLLRTIFRASPEWVLASDAGYWWKLQSSSMMSLTTYIFSASAQGAVPHQPSSWSKLERLRGPHSVEINSFFQLHRWETLRWLNAGAGFQKTSKKSRLHCIRWKTVI